MATEEPYYDELGIDIDVFIQDGEVFEVHYQGREIRARVYNYDVEFPCVANNLGQDEDGDYYAITIV